MVVLRRGSLVANTESLQSRSTVHAAPRKETERVCFGDKLAVQGQYYAESRRVLSGVMIRTLMIAVRKGSVENVATQLRSSGDYAPAVDATAYTCPNLALASLVLE